MNAFFKTYRRESILLGLLVLLAVFVALRQPSFVSPKNLEFIWHDSALLVAMALAQMLVIMSRGIDLSVAANLALTGMLVGMLGQEFPGLPIWVLLPLGLLIGLLLGVVNALLITALEIPPIVATLGTMSIFRGVIYVVSGGEWINSNEMSPAMQAFSSPNTRLLGLSMLEWVSIAAVILFFLLVHHSRFGREIRALGVNPVAAQYMGIPEKRRLFSLYALSGAVAGAVGVMWVGRYALANTEVALGFELQVIAACVLGGVSIAGGTGTVFGAVVGAFFLVTLYNALPVIGISPFWQMGLVGVAILLAAVFNQSAGRVVGKQILRKEGAAGD